LFEIHTKRIHSYLSDSMTFRSLIVVSYLSRASGSVALHKYNCFTKDAWTKEKRDWCCKEQHVGCETNCNQNAACTADLCPDGKARRHIGTDCCSCGEVKCGDEALVIPNMSCGKGRSECPGDSWCDIHYNDMWAVCCKKQEKYNCFSKEAWTEEKREWCCKEHQLGCKEGEETRMVMHEDGSTNTSANSTVNDFVSSALPYDCALAFLFALMSCSFPHREAGS